jgi:hypothetical protein
MLLGDMQLAAVAAPFVGVRTRAGLKSGRFPRRAPGVSTEPVRAAAAAFLASLSTEQTIRTVFAVEDSEWRRWFNVDNGIYVRQGVSLKEMTAEQRVAAMALLRESLSARGLALTESIRKTDQTLREINQVMSLDEDLYFFTVMGLPSATEPWGWQIDGHHLVINYFVLGDQVVMTPFFAGSEPVTAPSGKYKGLSILQEEQARGLALVNALDEKQRAQAILNPAKTGNNNLTEAWRDNVVLDYAGVRASTLTPRQRDQLVALVALYVGNLREGHAKVRMDEVRQHLDRTWFAWIGGTEPSSVFYYRIHSPVILVEFDHQRPANLRHLAADPDQPKREHVHVVVRTPNGNDYGKDLLRQHYAQHPHTRAAR